MSALVWMAAPLLATVIAALWVGWCSRPRRPQEAFDTVEEHARFRAALARTAARGQAPVHD